MTIEPVITNQIRGIGIKTGDWTFTDEIKGLFTINSHQFLAESQLFLGDHR